MGIDKHKKRFAKLRVQASTPIPQLRRVKTPSDQFDELFHDVQVRAEGDSKRFVDAVPLVHQRAIKKAYERERQTPDFDLMQFLGRYFSFPAVEEDEIHDPHTMSEHITALWPRLTRDAHQTHGSLIALPQPYIVPGGRFNEMFYWDSYFIMLGLSADGRVAEIERIIKNFTFLLHKYGYIPTGNRSYLLSRSQPPYFAQMIRLLAKHKGKRVLAQYLPYLLVEYRFWMKGQRKLGPDNRADRRVVLMDDGSVLNRYYDGLSDPRPESYPEDLKTAELAVERQAVQVYLDVRAAAESGWDFSSRWFRSNTNLSTIHTTDYVAVDLNCLLYELEMTIADAYDFLKQKPFASKFRLAAVRRAAAIQKYCWNDHQGFFYDYNHIDGKRSRHMTIAGIYPLSYGIASDEQAKRVAGVVKDKFLCDGGVVTTLINSTQQWDAPNGWAPLQWETIKGLRHYGHDALANEVKQQFLGCTQVTYDTHHKMVEKYNVMTVGEAASGGEYALQDGFGWTNGVVQALIKEDQ